MPNDVIAPSQRYSDFGTEIPMRQSDKTFDSSQLEYDAWRDLFRSKSGRYYSEGIKPSAFTGWGLSESVDLRHLTLAATLNASNGPIEMFAWMARTTTSRCFRLMDNWR